MARELHTAVLWTAAAGLVAGAVALAMREDEDEDVSMLPRVSEYPVDPAAPYGPGWGARRPPGLPPSARLCSVPRDAYPEVLQACRAVSDDPAFAQTIRHVSQTESGGAWGRPANNFDARCRAGGPRSDIPRYCPGVDGPRPAGTEIVTAWGLFGPNRDAWRSWLQVVRTGGRSWASEGTAFPWEADIDAELMVPVRVYLLLWNRARSNGAAALDAARVVRLSQRSPGASEAFEREAARVGWARAWSSVPRRHAGIIDRHLANAEVA